MVSFQAKPPSTTMTLLSSPSCSRTRMVPGLSERFSRTGGTRRGSLLSARAAGLAPFLALPGDAVQEADCLPVEIAVGVCLDAVGDDAQEQVAGQVRGGGFRNSFRQRRRRPWTSSSSRAAS